MISRDFLAVRHCPVMEFAAPKVDRRAVEALLSVARLDKAPLAVLPTLHRTLMTALELPTTLATDGSALDETDYWQRTPLHVACRIGNIKAVRALISSGASLDKRDYRGNTPLMTAVRTCNFDCAVELIQAHCDIECFNSFPDPYFYFPASPSLTGSFGILRLFHERKFAITKVTGYHDRGPLHWLSEIPEPEMAGLMISGLLEAGLDIESRDLSGLTPVGFAIRNNNVAILRHLIRSGAKVDGSCNFHGENILHLAAYYSGGDVMEYLITLRHIYCRNRRRDRPRRNNLRLLAY